MEILKTEWQHRDDRRIIQQLFTGNFEQVNLYQCPKNELLGNHYHKDTSEYFLILRGKFELEYGTVGRPKQKALFKMFDMFVLKPYEVHTIRCIDHYGRFLTFLTKKFDQANQDIFKESL